ncbi:MAG: hypothetical protein OEY14_18175, partial [Myxococcales bacterium]|nr:hypothetical protein [Myxococcales bacterium]
MSLQAQDVFAALVAALWALLVLGLALRRRSLERRRLERWLSALHPPATDPAPASSAASAALGPAAARLGEACALVHEGCAQGIALEAQAQRVAARAEADLHLFLRSISHALRTPFNALLGFTDVLLEAIDGSITREQRGALEIVRGSTEELSALFDDLLALSDPSAEGLRPPPAPVARPPNLEGIAAERRLQGGARPIEIRAEPSDPPPRFALDRSLDAAASRRAAENSSRAASDDARRRPLRDLLAGWLPGRLGAALAPARGRASASAWVAAALAIPAALLIGSQALGALVWFAPGAMITIAWLAIGSSRSRSRMDQELDRLACWAKGLLALGPGQRPTPLQLGSASLGSLQASLLRLVDRDQRRRAE